VEILLGVEVEVIMFFSFVKELRLHSVFALLDVLSDFELLSPQLIDYLGIALEKVFGHGCYIFIMMASNYRAYVNTGRYTDLYLLLQRSKIEEDGIKFIG